MAQALDGGLEAGATGPPREFTAGLMPESVLKIPVAIQVVIGTARLPLSKVAQLGPGSMIPLDQKLGSPATILVNGREVARGDLFVLEGGGERLGITITEVLTGGSPAVP